jgi:hypothetical protein
MFKRIAVLTLLVGVYLVSAKSGAKTYSFVLNDPAVAGDVQLKPGEYHIKFDGAQIVLTDKDRKPIDTNAKVETGERKFDVTAVTTLNQDGANRLVSIELGGSASVVVFQ